MRAAGIAVLLAVLWPLSPAWGMIGIPLTQWSARWDGLWIGGIALAIPVIALFVPAHSGGRSRRIASTGALILAGLAVLLKVVILTVPAPGFAACLGLPAMPADQACERSWNHPLAQNFTRIDTVIDIPVSTGLGASAWALSSANATTYNYFGPAQPNRDRLSITGHWSGNLDDPTSASRLEYVGEGQVVIDGTAIDMPPSYGTPRTIDLPAGSALEIDYSWRSTEVNRDGPPTTPYATLQLTAADGQPRTAAAAPGWSMAAALIAQLALWSALALLAVLILGFLWSARRDLRASIVPSGRNSRVLAWFALAAMAVAVVAMGRLQASLVFPIGITIILLAIVAVARATPRAPVRVLSAVIVAAAALAASASLTRGFPLITLRSGGSDPLTYEGQALEILTSRTLEGGESVFIYSPGFRYLLALQHLLLGDPDRGIVVLGVAGLLAGAVTATLMFTRRSMASIRLTRLASLALAVALLGFLIGSPDVLLGPRTLLSEYPTWILLLFAVPLALTGRGGGPLVGSSLLVGLALTMRGDQLPGLLVLLAIILIRQWSAWRAEPDVGAEPRVRARQRQWGWLIATLAAFGIPAALPALHNLAFGRQLVLLQTSIPLPVNFPLPPQTWPRLLTDSALQQVLREQLAGVLVIFGVHPEGVTTTPFLLAVRGIQGAMAVVLIAAIIHRFAGGWRRVLVLVLPAAFLVPHIVIQVYVYYPRHIVAGYLVAALALLALAGWATWQPADRPPPAIRVRNRQPVPIRAS